MDPRCAADFGLDLDAIHLNHGAFGCAPVVVREIAAAWRERAEHNPHRFNRVELPGLVASMRERAAGFVGLPADECGLVRNVSEGLSAVLASLELGVGDEVVVSNHGYGAVRIAMEHWARRRGVRVVVATFPLGADDDTIARAYEAVASPRTRLVVVDAITSGTATVLPVSAVSGSVDAPVLVDAAHAPGTLDVDVRACGATYWVGNLHKWAYTPRGSAVLWARDDVRDVLFPSVLSWQLELGFSRSFDYPGTWDYAGWLTIPDGLDYWDSLGGWDRVAVLSDVIEAGQRRVADLWGTSLECLPYVPAPTMRLVRLPHGLVSSPEDADALYERLSVDHRIEAAVVCFDGEGFVRLAAAPYNTAEDYEALAVALSTP